MKLNPIFRDHMVIAARLPIRIYGGGKGTINIRFAHQETTFVSQKEHWFTELAPMSYGGPYTLTVSFTDESV